jgi:hypothetical protein
LRDLVVGQAKINESLNKKLAANDNILENINTKVETLCSALKNQLSLNKMIETQMAQITAAILAAESGKIPGQLESPLNLKTWCLRSEATFPGGLPALTMQSGTTHQGTIHGMAWWQQFKKTQGSP